MVQQNADISALLKALRNSTAKNAAQYQAPTDNLQNDRIGLRDYQVNATRRAPNLSERLELIASGQPQAPSGALGTIGKTIVNNPITKTVLGGLHYMGAPRRAVQSTLLELKDALDSNEKTVASAKDWYQNYTDPTFGGGDLWKGKGWGHRIVGLGLDILLDPLTPATLGGTVAKKALLSTSAKVAAGINVAEQTTARGFIGTKYIANASGRNALARAVGKLGGTDDVVAQIAAQGRRAVPTEFVNMMNLQDYGIYYFGSRLRVPFSGTAGRLLASGLSKGRLGILKSNSGSYLQNLMTTGGTSGTLNVADLKIALSKNQFKDTNAKQALAVLAADEGERGVRNISNRVGGAYLRNEVSTNSGIQENLDSIYEFLDVPKEYWTNIPTQSQLQAIKFHKEQVAPWFIDKANEAGKDVGNIIASRDNWFPNKMTQYATRFLDNDRDPRVASILRWIKLDHTNMEGSFTARQFQNAAIKAINEGTPIDWFGTKLTERHMAGGIKTLNKLAREGGFKQDFFETNYMRAMTSYLDDFATHMGRQEFARIIANEGQDIGEWATSRGIITKEALDGIIEAPLKYKDDVVRSVAKFAQNFSELENKIVQSLKPVTAVKGKISGLSKEELAAVAAGDADAVVLGGPARIAANAADLQTQAGAKVQMEQALEASRNARTSFNKNVENLFSTFKDDSLALTVARSNLNDLNNNVLQYERQLDNIINIITDTGDANVFAGLRKRLYDDLAGQLKVLKQSANNSASFLNANLQMPELASNFEAILNGYRQPKFGIQNEIYDIAKYGRNFEFRKDYVDRTTLKGVTTKEEAEAVAGQVKGLGQKKISYLLKVTESLDTQVGQPGYVPPKGIKSDKTLDALSKVFTKSEQVNDWVKLRTQLNIGDISENSLIKLNSQEVLSTLVKGMTSTEVSNLGAIREAIAWIYLREQLLDPGFATRELQNAAFGGEGGIAQRMENIVQHFKLMKIKVVERPRVKTPFVAKQVTYQKLPNEALEAEVKRINAARIKMGKRPQLEGVIRRYLQTYNRTVYGDSVTQASWPHYVADDAGLPKQAAFISAEKNRPIIQRQLLDAQADLRAIDAVAGRSGQVVLDEYDAHLSRMGVSNLDTRIDVQGYAALVYTFMDLNDIHQDDNIGSLIKYFEDKVQSIGTFKQTSKRAEDAGEVIPGGDQVITDDTYREINDFLSNVFSNKRLSGSLIGTDKIRVFNQAQSQYNPIGNESLSATVQRRIAELQNDLGEIDKIVSSSTKGLTPQEAKDLTLLDSGGVGNGISRLAYEVGVRYLELENKYALDKIDDLLRPFNQPLTPTGQAVVTKQVVDNFKENLQGQTRHLRLAKQTMEEIYKTVNAQPDEQYRILMDEVALRMKDPEVRESFETIFPSIVIQSDIRATSSLDNRLRNTSQYETWVNDVINFRVGPGGEGVSPAATPTGGGGMIESGELLVGAPAQKAAAQRKLVGRQQAVSDAMMRSPELQKQVLKTEFLQQRSHSARQNYLNGFIKEQKEKLNALAKSKPKKGAPTKGKMVFGTDEGYLGVARETRFAGRPALTGVTPVGDDATILGLIRTAEALKSKGDEISDAVIEDSAILDLVPNIKKLGVAQGGAGSRSKRAALQQAARSEDSLSYRSIGNLYATAINGRSTSRRAIRELFSNLFGGQEYANPLLIGESYVLNQVARKGGPSLRIVRPEDSFFGRATAQLDKAVEKVNTAFPTGSTPETLLMEQKRAYVERLEQKLIEFKQRIKEEPKLLKAVLDAQTALDKAEGASAKAGGRLKRRITNQGIIKAWEESQSKTKFPSSFPFIDRNAYTPTQANKLNQWVIAKRQLAEFEGNEIYTIAHHDEQLKDFAIELSSVKLTQVQDEIGNLRWGLRSPDIIGIQNELAQKRQLLNEAIISGNEEIQQAIQADIAKIQSRFANVSNAGGVRTWTADDTTLLKAQVARSGIIRQGIGENLDDYAPNIILMEKGGIRTLEDKWGKNYDQLLARAEDESKAPLMFMMTDPADGRNYAYSVNSSSLEEVGIGGQPYVATVADKLAEFRARALADKSAVTVLEPKTLRRETVNAAGQTVSVVEAARMVPGTDYLPENVWLGIDEKTTEVFAAENTAKLKKTSDLTNLSAKPVNYYPLTQFDGFKLKEANYAIKYVDGTDFRFTDVDELVISADWSNPVYKLVRTENMYNTERFKLFGLLSKAENEVAESKKIMSMPGGNAPYGRSQPRVKKRKPGQIGGGVDVYGTVADRRAGIHYQRVQSAVKLQQRIEELDLARTAFVGRPETHRKVSWLYNYMDNARVQQDMGAIKPDASINSQTGLPVGISPVTALKRYFKPYKHPDSTVSLSIPEAEKTIRFGNIEGVWKETPEYKTIIQAQKLRSTISETAQDFSEDNKLFADIGIAATALEAAKKSVGTSADQLKIDLQNALVVKGIQVGEPTTAVVDSKMLQKGIKELDKQTEIEIAAMPMLQKSDMSPSLWQHQIAVADDVFSRATGLQREFDAFTKTPGQGISDFLETPGQASARIPALKDKLTKSGLGKTEQVKLFKEYKKLQQALVTKRTVAGKMIKKGSGEIVQAEKVLSRAQTMFDNASIATTDNHVLLAQQDLNAIQEVLQELKQFKQYKGKKITEENLPLIAKEFDVFLKHAQPLLQSILSPDVDKTIQSLSVRYVNSYTEYLRSAANLGEMEQISLLAKGLSASGTYYTKAGKLIEGYNSEDINPVFRGALNEEFLLGFNKGFVELSKNFPNVGVAPEIAELVRNVHRLNEPAVLRELNRWLGRYTQFFKAYATLSPGFHMRNGISNGFMLFAAGGNPKYLMEGLGVSRLFNQAIENNLTVEQFLTTIPKQQQLFAHEAIKASSQSGGGNTAELLSSLYSRSKWVDNVATRTSRKIGVTLETHSRFMLAYDGVRQGMDANTAASRVRRYLIDYEDLSTLDKSMRQIIPFWMWTSRNLPMQVQNIWMNPRAYQIYANIKRNFTDENAENESVPSWMKEMGAFKLPFGQDLYATPDIGFNRLQSDINMLQDPRRFLSNVNPAIRLPIELMGDRQLFSNKRFSQTPVEVTGGVGSAMQPLLELLGYGQTGPTGAKFVNDKAYYATRNILPFLGRAESLNPSTPTDPTAESNNPLMGFLGLPVKQATPKMRSGELKRQEAEMKNALQNYLTINNPKG